MSNKPVVVAVVNQKGGSGKTTISTNITHALHINGYKSMLVDTDPQGTARTWSAECKEDLFPVVGLDRDNLGRELKKISNGFDWIVLDGAPQLKRMSAAAISASDIVLIPVQPSPYDIWATEELVEIIKEKQEIKPNLKAAFLISRAIKKTKLNNEVRKVLNEFGLSVFKNSTSQFVHYPTTAAEGKTVFSISSHQACSEINAITQELIKFSKIKEKIYA
jgi:chromosome partitioning protein